MEAPTHHRAIALLLTLVLAAGLAKTLGARRTPGAHRAHAHVHASPGAGAPDAAARAPARIDPNAADTVALESLPGVGPALARRILDARNAGAVFRVPEDLRRVRGIGPRTLERIAPLLEFRDVAPRDAVTGPSSPETRTSL